MAQLAYLDRQIAELRKDPFRYDLSIDTGPLSEEDFAELADPTTTDLTRFCGRVDCTPELRKLEAEAAAVRRKIESHPIWRRIRYGE